MDRYTTKRWLLRPLTAWRRRRAGRLGPINTAVFEACDYRPSMVKFFVAAREDPDILVDVDLPTGGVVLDVGAYEGSWSKRILARADQVRPARDSGVRVRAGARCDRSVREVDGGRATGGAAPLRP